MKTLRMAALASATALACASGAGAGEFDGVELKMLAIGDTSVTRLAPIVGEFEELTGAKVQIDMFPYPGLIDKIVIEASANNPSYQLMWVDSPWVGVLGESGALEDLTDLVKRDADEINLDDIIPIQLQAAPQAAAANALVERAMSRSADNVGPECQWQKGRQGGRG